MYGNNYWLELIRGFGMITVVREFLRKCDDFTENIEVGSENSRSMKKALKDWT